MGGVYGSKIRAGEINEDTGEKWKFEDVPQYWKKRTEEWLNQNSNRMGK